MKYYLESIEDVFKETGSGESGLTEAEAALRLEKNGRNQLDEGKKVGILRRFFGQLADPMVLVLIAAAIISAITSALRGEPQTDVFIILSVVVLNTVLGIVQESKAEKAMEALKSMTEATSRVIRDGKELTVRSEELVVGDLVVIEAGDAVPADGRIVESVCLRTEESALTGESAPAEKTASAISGENVPLGDRHNMCYMGSCAVYGRGKFVITAAGMDTEMGRIAKALTDAEKSETPLQKKLDSLSKVLTVIVLAVCLFMFVFGLIRSGSHDPSSVLEVFMLAVSLAVAAIPEGLAAVVTIVLSIGVTKMSKNHAIIRRLTAVETLGCTQVICSDKTGTLTQNKMTVTAQTGENPRFTALSLALCTDAHFREDGSSEGDPTETALIAFARSLGMEKSALEKQYPRVSELPFDSERKLMTTFHRSGNQYIQFTKGAPDVLIGKCTFILQNGQTVPLTGEIRKKLTEQNAGLAGNALRVIASAYRIHDILPDDMVNAESDMIFIGMAGMIDPVRPEVPDAIRKCRMAGIRPVMITGDHPATAAAIASQLGIIRDDSQLLTGTDIDRLSDSVLAENIHHYGAFARVRPEHKTRIVNAWKKRGYVTAMTGDGVNDAPSVKAADIGIGMGISGTDVTKNVSDMILADDNFATIVASVSEGRRIYDNIRKAIRFLLSSNLSEVVSIFAATMLGFTILKPIHILFINLITDSLPALALGLEPEEPGIMERKPRDPKKGIFADGVGFSVFYQGILVSLLTLTAYFLGHFCESGIWEIAESPDGMTMAFLTMSMCEIFHSYNMRSSGSIFSLHTKNIALFGAMLLSLILTAAVIFIPSLSGIFSFEPISLTEYIASMLLALAVIPLVEAVKRITGRK